MLGAIAGDIIGSIYENFRTKNKDFRLFTPLSYFTDDTVLTVAVADALLNGHNFATSINGYARRRPFRGYGPKFFRWMLLPGAKPYNSLGNGSAMRVSPVAYAAETESEVFALAKQSAECTHDHPEGVKGAQAVAFAIYIARHGGSKDQIRTEISQHFAYDLDRTIDAIRPDYSLDLTCQGSVPEAIIAFLDSTDFEDAIRNAVSLGGDADTQAAIAGSIAEAHYGGIPEDLLVRIWRKLPASYRRIVGEFARRYSIPTEPPK